MSTVLKKKDENLLKKLRLKELTKRWSPGVDGVLTFQGTEKDFEDWKKLWKQIVVHCEDFHCCHELMSCGYYIGCGDCTSYRGATERSNVHGICNSVSCIDCTQKSTCIKSKGDKQCRR